MSVTGSCLCGGVSIEITGPIKHVIYCHCSICRKSHGTAFASFGLVSESHFKLIGENMIQRFLSSPKVIRSFCSVCGSNIEWSDQSEYNEGYRSFALGLLDSDFKPESEEHIFECSAPKWGQNRNRSEDHS
ncbi:GFA family protein [Vibrio tapetis subsp. quintayensis]|uniref:GFA family protein n=1 Tax=Vibrio tapetis TaxID=52443 RepID=UPI0025B48FD7|nr:GFA family protein [Vibrio tapetis]MDN3679988.1 GFA family protein [Vibrio tapetis subsp. quintayensis]